MGQINNNNKSPVKCTAGIRIQHVVHCMFMLVCIAFSVYQQFQYERGLEVDARNCNLMVIALVYLLRIQNVIAMFPMVLFQLLGLFLYDAFPGDVPLKGSPADAPFICFRTITRGDYSDLVRENVRRNLKTCRKMGLVNFIIEVVTDKAVNIPKTKLTREVVVPQSYRTKNGALFKARGLQYCLEDDVNKLSDDDWIVHLDEESLLTENSLKGIINFILDGRHQFGQGLITYANEKIVNWLTTCADCFRVADDMGKLRFQFKAFHRPVFGWKGSYMVCLAGAEKKVSFDHGLEGSIIEDVFFGMIAFKKGYSFDFIEGEMWEKSPFTLADLIRQRKRWIVGAIQLLKSSAIPLRYKFCYGVYVYNYLTFPLLLLDAVLEVMFRPSVSLWLMCFLSAARGGFVYIFLYGGLKSFSIQRLGFVKFFVCIFSIWCSFILLLAVESVVTVWIIFDPRTDFYIVEKRIRS